ncbi:MAG: sulfurtransferase [Tatlockia sp.]|nr:sulfurtransferase [Tatlockia sp.]
MKQHTPLFLKLVSAAKKQTKLITPQDLQQKINKGEPIWLIDVREESEWNQGHIPKAIHLSKGIIERDLEKLIPDQQTPIILYCSGGFRSILAADNLNKMGYTQVYSLEAGSQGWREAGFEWSI